MDFHYYNKKRMIWISSGWIYVQFYFCCHGVQRQKNCTSNKPTAAVTETVNVDVIHSFSFFFFFTVMRRRQGVQLTSGSPAFALSVVFVFVCSILMDMNMNIILSCVSPGTAELIMSGQKLFHFELV